MSKYRAKRTTVDGVTFHSAKEAARYQELRLLEKAGEIRQLRLQVPLELNAGNPVPQRIGEYRADFVYEERLHEDWCLRIEDTKGMDTPLSKWKRKHVQAQYGIQVRLT